MLEEILDQNEVVYTSQKTIFFNSLLIACIPFFIEVGAVLVSPFYFDRYLPHNSRLISKIIVLFFENFYWVLGITAVQLVFFKTGKKLREFALILMGSLIFGSLMTILYYCGLIEAYAPIFYGDQLWNLKINFWYGTFLAAKVITVISLLVHFLLNNLRKQQ